MNLIIDQGNSTAKVALFDQDKLVRTSNIAVLTHSVLTKIFMEFQPQAGIISSVIARATTEAIRKKDDGLLRSARNDEQNVIAFLKDNIPAFYELTHQLPLPLKIDYQTPETLGVDRIAAAVGAFAQQPNENLLVIDIGTAITIDFVTADGIYKGGNISPGPETRFKSLHEFTGRLPLVDENGKVPVLGYDTATAIRSGVITGIAHELDAYIDEFQKNHAVSVFLTGGYAFYFADKLKNGIFADENLVLTGLNEILQMQGKR